MQYLRFVLSCLANFQMSEYSTSDVVVFGCFTGIALVTASVMRLLRYKRRTQAGLLQSFFEDTMTLCLVGTTGVECVETEKLIVLQTSGKLPNLVMITLWALAFVPIFCAPVIVSEVIKARKAMSWSPWVIRLTFALLSCFSVVMITVCLVASLLRTLPEMAISWETWSMIGTFAWRGTFVCGGMVAVTALAFGTMWVDMKTIERRWREELNEDMNFAGRHRLIFEKLPGTEGLKPFDE